MHKNNFSAFSLIEISIVILIIGILVAGVTSGSKMINKATLSNARTFSQSTSVHNLQRNILLWLDATSETAIPDSEQTNATAVSTWKEIRPAITASTATSCASPGQPQYIVSGLNGMPALQFDGTDDCMSVGAPYSSNLVSSGANFSVFVVAQATGTTPVDTEASSGVAGTVAPHKYLIFPNFGGGNNAGAGISFGTNGTYFYEHASSYLPPIMASSTSSTKAAVILQEYTNNTPKFYLNGALIRTGLTSTKKSSPHLTLEVLQAAPTVLFKAALAKLLFLTKF